MGDDHDGTAADEFFQDFLDQLLALQIDLAGGLIEDQDGRIAENRAGQGNPLPLPAGDLAPLGTDDGVVAVGQFVLDEAVRVGLIGGVDDLLHRRLRRAVADVVAHRIVEQQRILGDQADLPPQIQQPHFGRSGNPSSRISPCVGSANRGIRFASVVFPQPLGPTMARVSPKRIRRLMSWSTG